MIDTHCHLTFPQLQKRLDAVLAGAREAGVDRMISVGTTPSDVFAARDVAHAHPGVFFTAGVHPHYAAEVEAEQIVAMQEVVKDERCVAFGEMGLDYHYDDPSPTTQQDLFEAQLAAIAMLEDTRPIVIHCRKAVDDTLAVIAQFGPPGERFVFHCFTESPDDCRKVLDAGCMISFTGIVTYKNAPDVRESAKLVPADRIMIETDAPYLSPEPHRKVRPNEPKFVVDTARFLADLRGEPFEAFVEQVDRNAERFYNLSGAT